MSDVNMVWCFFVRCIRVNRILHLGWRCAYPAYGVLSLLYRGELGSSCRMVSLRSLSDLRVGCRLAAFIRPPLSFILFPLSESQITRSFPPSTATCAPVVLPVSGLTKSRAIIATSRLVTVFLSTLFCLYCSTLKP
jgi:hypothetical protein